MVELVEGFLARHIVKVNTCGEWQLPVRGKGWKIIWRNILLKSSFIQGIGRLLVKEWKN